MQPRIISFHSPDAADLEKYTPSDPASFAVLVEMSIGLVGATGEDVFDVLVCSPGWIARVISNGEFLNGRYHVMTAGYSWPDIESYLQRLVARCGGDTWPQVASRLGELLHWEFADGK